MLLIPWNNKPELSITARRYCMSRPIIYGARVGLGPWCVWEVRVSASRCHFVAQGKYCGAHVATLWFFKGVIAELGWYWSGKRVAHRVTRQVKINVCVP